MARTNKHGVSDYIPADVKLEVRRRCGFGCVVCGSPFYDYEHWNPEFADLQGEHSADGITLCCPNCHRKKGGLLSQEEYRESIRSPKALSDCFIKTKWSSAETPDLYLGSIRCMNINYVIVVDDVPIIAFLKPEEPDAPPRLIARFFDSNGKEQFRIDHNECIGNPNAWDLTSNRIGDVGWSWVVRKGKGEVELDVSIFPPNKIVVNQMSMQFGFLRIRANKRGFQASEMTSDKGFINRFYISGGSVRANDAKHVFFGVRRSCTANPLDCSIAVSHSFSTNNITIDAEGGEFSIADNHVLI